MLVEKPGEKRNADIYPIQSMPTLTYEIAQEFIEAVYGDNEFEYIYDDQFDTIDDAAAEALAKHEGELSLNGLTQLSDAAAKALAKHQGNDLFLDGLAQLGDAAAKALAKHRGSLYLNGLTQLSDAAAKALANHQGRFLSLGGLTQISDAAAKALAKHQGRFLSLGGLTQISDVTAEALAKRQSGLSLHGLRQFSEAAAEMLSKHRSRVLRHREDGPAFTDAHGDRRWWFDGNQYDTAGEWAEAVLKSRNEPHDAKCVQQFLRHVLCKEDLI
jgi:hypothetical protein